MEKFFITGSSQGIGKSLTDLLLRRKNTNVTGISRTNNIQHERFRHLPLNLSDSQLLISMLDDVYSDIDKYDKLVLVNNAGYLGEIKYFGDLVETDLIDIYNTNVIAPAILMNSFIRKTNSIDVEKVIINISSGAGRRPYDGWGGYCSSKSAIDMMSLVADMENEKNNTGYKIFAIAPGPVETNMQKQLRNASSDNFSQVNRFKELSQKGKMASPDEIAVKLAYFIDNAGQYEGAIQDIRKIKFI